MVEEYARNSWSDGTLAAMFPIMKYHSKWSELGKEDFCFPHETGSYYTFGQEMISLHIPSPNSKEDIDFAADTLYAYDSGKTVERINGIYAETVVNKELYKPFIPETNLKYFLRIKDLCDEHGSELILIRACWKSRIYYK